MLREDDCDFFDSVYLPSKYPIGSALPYFSPDGEICKKPVLIAENLLKEIYTLVTL
jgi:hypothetical protein